MVGDLGDHRHVGSRARQDGLVDPLHVVGDKRRQRLDQTIGRLFFERNDNSHETLSLARRRASTIKTAKRRGKSPIEVRPLVEIMRTNDLVLISVIESLLTAERVGFFVADQHMAAVEGSLGFLPRRIHGRCARGGAGAPAHRPRRASPGNCAMAEPPHGSRAIRSPTGSSGDAGSAGGSTLVQPKGGHRVGTDAALLAAAAGTPAGRIADVGAGVGAVGLAISAAAVAAGARRSRRDRPRSGAASPRATPRGTGFGRASASSARRLEARARREAGSPTKRPIASSPTRRFSNREPFAFRRTKARARAHVFAAEAGRRDPRRLAAGLARAAQARRPVRHDPPPRRARDHPRRGREPARRGRAAAGPSFAGAPAHRVLISGVKGSKAPLGIAPALILHQSGGAAHRRGRRDPPRRGAHRLGRAGASGRVTSGGAIG